MKIYLVYLFHLNARHERKRITTGGHVKLVQDTINSIHLKLNKSININLVGDKGYVTQKKFNINNKLINIIVPNKKYKKRKLKKININNKQIIVIVPKKKQKKLNNKKKYLLSKRIVVEHSINNLKRVDRLMLRKDKYNFTFLSFIYLQLILLFSDKFNKK